MVEFERRKDAQHKESAQEQKRTRKEAQKRSGRAIRSRTIYFDKDIVCNQAPVHLNSRDQDLVPCLPGLSSNSRTVYYEDAATRGQVHQGTDNEEEEIVPEDSTSTRLFPTHGLTNALDVLVLVRDGTSTEEDMVTDHAQLGNCEEALQPFQVVQAELDDVLADDDNGEFDVSRQPGRRRAEPPKTMKEETLEKVFMEQEIAGPSTITKYEAGARPLFLENDESAIMSSLDSQLSDAAAHSGNPFWGYKKTLHGAPNLPLNPIADKGIPRKADYEASNVEMHDKEPTICLTVGTKTGRDGCSVPKIQHYRRPFTQPTLCPSARSHRAGRYKQAMCSDTKEGEDMNELAE